MNDPMRIIDSLRAALHSRTAERWLRDHEGAVKSAVLRALQQAAMVREDAPPQGTIGYTKPSGFPFPGQEVGAGFQQATPGGKLRGTTFDDETKRARTWLQRHAQDTSDAFDRALRVGAQPTIAAIDDAFRRWDAEVGNTHLPGLVFVESDRQHWIEREHPGTVPSTLKRWRRLSATQHGTYEPVDNANLEYLLKKMTDWGQKPTYRLGIVFRDRTITQGSGSLAALDLFTVSSPLRLPNEWIAYTAQSKEKSRSSKDVLISGMKAQGWTYHAASLNEYLTQPDGKQRMQIKATRVRTQYRGEGGVGWFDGGSQGSIADVVVRMLGVAALPEEEKAKRAKSAARAAKPKTPRVKTPKPMTDEEKEQAGYVPATLGEVKADDPRFDALWQQWLVIGASLNDALLEAAPSQVPLRTSPFPVPIPAKNLGVTQHKMRLAGWSVYGASNGHMMIYSEAPPARVGLWQKITQGGYDAMLSRASGTAERGTVRGLPTVESVLERDRQWTQYLATPGDAPKPTLGKQLALLRGENGMNVTVEAAYLAMAFANIGAFAKRSTAPSSRGDVYLPATVQIMLYGSRSPVIVATHTTNGSLSAIVMPVSS